MTTTQAWRPAARWSGTDRLRLACEVLGAYVRVRLVLRGRTLPQAVAELRTGARRSAIGPAGPPAGGEELRLGRAVVRVLRVLPSDSRCLMRSLVLVFLLCRRQVETTLVVAARPAPTFAAHAWVERDGRALLDPGDAAYSRLLEL